MWERILVILRKEFLQTLREPKMRVLLFVPPMLQLLIFGYAVNLDVDHVRIAWADGDRSPQSRDLRQSFEASGRFDVVAMPREDREVQELLDRGQVQAVVRILPGFARDLERGTGAAVQVLVDGDQFEYGVAGGELCRTDHRPVLGCEPAGAAQPAGDDAQSGVRAQPGVARRGGAPRASGSMRS